MSRRVLLGLLAGAVWGALGFALAGQQLGPATWVGLAAAPAIGLAIALVFRRFSECTPGVRIALSLLSLYVAAGLFALAAGIADALRPIPDRIPWAVVTQSVIGVWWGVTFTGWLPLLWALAYGTHALLSRVERSGGPRRSTPSSGSRTPESPPDPARGHGPSA